MGAELLYYLLRELAESHGFVNDHADELLADAAGSIADDPRNVNTGELPIS